MERVIERCCGLDVHKKTVVACVRVPGRTSVREQHVRTFGTTTAELLALRDWLGGYGVTHVAMESTGVYWKPIFYVLEDAFTCVLANAAQIALVPGRKTDVKDCAWIAQLLEHPRSRRLGRPGARRRKLPALRQALAGRFRPHHAFLVSQVLAHLDYLDEVIETLSTHLDEVMAPCGGGEPPGHDPRRE